MKSNFTAQEIHATLLSGRIVESDSVLARTAYAQALVSYAGTQAVIRMLLNRGILKLPELDAALEAEFRKALDKLTTPKIQIPGAGLNGSG